MKQEINGKDNGNMDKKISVLEKVFFKPAGLLGSPLSLTAHILFVATVLLLMIFRVLDGRTLLILAAVISLEAIYLSLFNYLAFKRNSQALAEVREDVLGIMEEEKESHKLMINILHFAHQMKSFQKDLDTLKRSGVLKRTNGNSHRAHA